MSGALGTWIDGRAGHAVPADDRGLLYGDGLFETILVRNGTPRFLEAHLARLSAGCARLGIQPDPVALRADVSRAAAQAPALAILKIIVTRGSAERRGYAPQGALIARRIVSLWPTADSRALAEGVTLGLARTVAATNPALAGVKHLNRLDNVLAAAEIPADAFDVLMRDSGGRIISGTACNVFAVRGGRIATPALDTAGVAGVMRGIVMREAPHVDVVFRVRALELEDLMTADALFVTNARVGVVPVRRVGEHSFHMSDVILKLRAHIESLDA